MIICITDFESQGHPSKGVPQKVNAKDMLFSYSGLTDGDQECGNNGKR